MLLSQLWKNSQFELLVFFNKKYRYTAGVQNQLPLSFGLYEDIKKKPKSDPNTVL